MFFHWIKGNMATHFATMHAGSKGEPLEFAQRLNIAIDIVHAIAYLHGYTGTHSPFLYEKLCQPPNLDAYDIHIWHNPTSAYLIVVLNVITHQFPRWDNHHENHHLSSMIRILYDSHQHVYVLTSTADTKPSASLCLTNIFLRWEADHPIIHRDIKSSNILLTEHLRAKVADFGFARLAPENPEATHVSTLVKGTAGYVDPEYLRTSQLTDRSDVYSFGVLLVELVTGRRPIERGRGRGRHQRLTTEWVKQAHPNKTSASDTEMYRTWGVWQNYRAGAGAAQVQGGLRSGGDGPPDAADQRCRGGGGEGDGAGSRVHGSGSRRASSNAALRRVALVRETRLAAGAAARVGRERRSEAARWLHVRAAVGYESEAGQVPELEMICCTCTMLRTWGGTRYRFENGAAAECSLVSLRKKNVFSFYNENELQKYITIYIYINTYFSIIIIHQL
jgi:hypothetical protein